MPHQLARTGVLAVWWLFALVGDVRGQFEEGTPQYEEWIATQTADAEVRESRNAVIQGRVMRYRCSWHWRCPRSLWSSTILDP